MKITIDRRYTTIANEAAVKAASKELKERLTETDLLVMFDDAFGGLAAGDCISCNAEAYSTDPDGAIINFHFNIIVDAGYKFARARFFVTFDGQDFKINEDARLVSVREYEEIR